VPNAPPVSANKVLSVRSCRMMRERLAPSAVRSDISLTRAAERTSMRLATLTAAISSTSVAAAIRTSKANRTSPRMNSLTGSALKLNC